MRALPLAISRWAIWVVFLLVLLSFAQSTEVCHSQSQANNQDTIRINVELVVLHATVLDRKRRPIAGLGQANFQVYEEGVLQEIESFSHEDIPVTVGLVIDNSGSMRPKRTEVS